MGVPDNPKNIAKLIDFGASLNINELNGDIKDNESNNVLKRRTNMNTPESIIRFLKLSPDKTKHPELIIKDEWNSYDSNFSRWYYFPLISIFCMLLCNKELWTGNTFEFGIFDIKSKPASTSSYEFKYKILEYILDTSLAKEFITTNLTLEIKEELNKTNKLDAFKYALCELIDGMCVGNSLDRCLKLKLLLVLIVYSFIYKFIYVFRFNLL